MRARDRTCRIPHCNRAAIHCQIDHNVERQDGGPTTACNLGPLCPKHHRRKSRKLWHVKHTGDGRFDIESPLGVRYVVQPEPVDDLWDLPDDLWDWTDTQATMATRYRRRRCDMMNADVVSGSDPWTDRPLWVPTRRSVDREAASLAAIVATPAVTR